MARSGSLVILAIWAILAPNAAGQTPPARFRWLPGQVLAYKFEQATNVIDVVEGTKAETSTKLVETKRWQVVGVDTAGAATLQLALTALRLETKTSGGETLVFDSAAPDKSSPQLKEQLAKFVGPALAVIRVDARGKVIEVKECKHGPASRLESEPPFGIVLPEQLAAGQSWDRPYQITLEPPQGTGEKLGAMQKYGCKSINTTAAVITLATSIPNPPPASADRLPLLPFLTQGEVVFDVQAGLVKSVRLQIDREVLGHQGEGSSYQFKSTTTEEYLGSR